MKFYAGRIVQSSSGRSSPTIVVRFCIVRFGAIVLGVHGDASRVYCQTIEIILASFNQNMHIDSHKVRHLGRAWKLRPLENNPLFKRPKILRGKVT
jgi:hypothetical protein